MDFKEIKKQYLKCTDDYIQQYIDNIEKLEEELIKAKGEIITLSTEVNENKKIIFEQKNQISDNEKLINELNGRIELIERESLDKDSIDKKNELDIDRNKKLNNYMIELITLYFINGQDEKVKNIVCKVIEKDLFIEPLTEKEAVNILFIAMYYKMDGNLINKYKSIKKVLTLQIKEMELYEYCYEFINKKNNATYVSISKFEGELYKYLLKAISTKIMENIYWEYKRRSSQLPLLANINLINSKGSTCSYDYGVLELVEVKLSYYGHKEAKKSLGYSLMKVFRCKECKRYFITDKQIQESRKIHGKKVYHINNKVMVNESVSNDILYKALIKEYTNGNKIKVIDILNQFKSNKNTFGILKDEEQMTIFFIAMDSKQEQGMGDIYNNIVSKYKIEKSFCEVYKDSNCLTKYNNMIDTCIGKFIYENKDKFVIKDNIINKILQNNYKYVPNIELKQGVICKIHNRELVRKKVFIDMINSLNVTKVVPYSMYICDMCKTAYISEKELEDINEKYRPYKLRLSNEKYNSIEKVENKDSVDVNEINLNKESPLKVMGYNTSVGREERWRILTQLAMPKLGKAQVISYLKYFINFHGKKANMKNAVYEWKYDLDRIYKV